MRNIFIIYDEVKFTGQKLGKGSAGEVELGEYEGKKVAVKRFVNDNLNEIIEKLRKHKNLRSENIIEFYGVIRSPNDKMYLVTKFAKKGTLHDYFEKNEPGWSIKAKIAIDIANGLLECHKYNIVYLDLKSENILVDILVNKHLVLKISDFSLSITKAELDLGKKAGGAKK
ncbi:325_t:CDS:2 [Dentiscutata erythropus]|uniref:325_t:CDS:1 n=1 Tax=Dentiscutata erythropus TaxID=1348616 RepID=A0A9N9H3U0_9GLOM|nr:325_t:CDS:2 [Dentiscutata erythropus]